MKALMDLVRGLLQGMAAGGALSGLICLSGFLGGEGWQRTIAGKALGLALLPILIFLLAVLITTGWGRQFRLNLTEEDYERRASMIPFVVGMTLVVLIVYLIVLPPYPSLPDVPPPEGP